MLVAEAERRADLLQAPRGAATHLTLHPFHPAHGVPGPREPCGRFQRPSRGSGRRFICTFVCQSQETSAYLKLLERVQQPGQVLAVLVGEQVGILLQRKAIYCNHDLDICIVHSSGCIIQPCLWPIWNFHTSLEMMRKPFSGFSSLHCSLVL